MSDLHWLVKLAQETPLSTWPYTAEDCLKDQFVGGVTFIAEAPAMCFYKSSPVKRLRELVAAHKGAVQILEDRRTAAATERKVAA